VSKLTMSEIEKHPNPVDVYVGARVRARRKVLDLSQGDLAQQIDLTFQQVQKYERGTNRISASKLYEISKVVKVPVAYFFDGFADEGANSVFTESDSERDVNAFLLTVEGLELAEIFPRLPSAKHRRKILDLVKSLAYDH
jgi:transcriptional regulator with XRE-family HTH domain